MEERLATLLVLGAVLRGFDDEGHLWHEECTGIAGDLLADDSCVFD
jgi:hypothetical protein